MNPLNSKIINEGITLLILVFGLLVFNGTIKSKIGSNPYYVKNKNWLIIVFYIVIAVAVIKIGIDLTQ